MRAGRSKRTTEFTIEIDRVDKTTRTRRFVTTSGNFAANQKPPQPAANVTSFWRRLIGAAGMLLASGSGTDVLDRDQANKEEIENVDDRAID